MLADNQRCGWHTAAAAGNYSAGERILSSEMSIRCQFATFYQRDAMLARVFATATCLSVYPSHVGIVPSRAKAGS